EPNTTPALRRSGRKRKANESASVAGIELTHADRPIFPGAEVTKRSLAELYATFEDLILPHVKNRPLVLLRCPEGGRKKCFFQKHPRKSFPASLPRVRVRESKGDEEYLVIHSTADLIALVQLNVVEFHSWGCRE